MGVVEVTIDDGIAHVEFNRPKKLNAMNLEMRRAFVAACLGVSNNNNVRCVIISGRGKAFSAGHDLLEQIPAEEASSDPGGAGMYAAICDIKQPVIAAINGLCVAQGAGVGLLCDIRVADRTVEFAWPHAQRGISSVSGPVILARQVPGAIASDLLFTGRSLSATEALRLGLLTEMVEPGETVDRAIAIGRRVCEMAPLSLRSMKETMVHTRDMPLRSALVAGEGMARLLNFTEDASEGHLAFAEGRPGRWKGC